MLEIKFKQLLIFLDLPCGKLAWQLATIRKFCNFVLMLPSK